MNTPVEILATLLRDEDLNIRTAVSENPSIPGEILRIAKLDAIRLKAGIIHKFSSDNFYNEEYSDFFEFNDLGVPLAESLSFGLCELTDEGIKLINDTYDSLCIELDKDERQGYASVEDFFKSPKE